MKTVRVLFTLAMGAAAACRPPAVVPPPPVDGARLTHGVAAEVTDTTAVIWGRCDRLAEFHVELVGDPPRRLHEITAGAHDNTAKVALHGLQPGRAYDYRAWCGAEAADAVAARLHTAPAAPAATALRFVWGGDVGGQNVCRDQAQGYAVFDDIVRREPDFFIALGDMIYADDACLPTGRYGNTQLPGPVAPATTLDEFWAIWAYHRADAAQQRLLARTPYLAVWDDHETLNDAGPHQDSRRQDPGRHLLPIGLAAFLDYQPIRPPRSAPTQLYRRLRWGKHADVFVLDTRQYRDANARPDVADKSMLNAAQREWLIDGVTRSDATWKIIVSSVPLAIPTGFPPEAGRDGWANYDQATGFEHELETVLRAFQRWHVRNLVWLTTDVHFATGFRYRPFPETPGFEFYEFTSGPLNAGVFPIREVDTSFHPERLFLHAPSSAEAIADFADAQRWFNYGMVEIDEAGDLRVQIINARGDVVYDAPLPRVP